MEAVTRFAQPDAGDLIASAAAGDEYAFRRIIAAHHEDMRRVCAYVTRDDALAEEATYAAWAKAWRRLGSVREPASLRPWLVSIAVNEAKRILGKRKRRTEFESTHDPVDHPGGVDPATGVAAIDLRRGRVVRLLQGRADAETVYFDNPAEPAAAWRTFSIFFAFKQEPPQRANRAAAASSSAKPDIRLHTSPGRSATARATERAEPTTIFV